MKKNEQSDHTLWKKTLKKHEEHRSNAYICALTLPGFYFILFYFNPDYTFKTTGTFTLACDADSHPCCIMAHPPPDKYSISD